LHDIDIIIITYNSSEYLLECLDSTYGALRGLSGRVFVVDNASQDDVEEAISSFPDVRLLKIKKNCGYAGAVNACLPLCRAPFILVMNPDIVIDAGCFRKILRFMKENKDVAVVGPKVFGPDRKVQGSARSFPTPLTAFFGRSSLLTRLLPNNRMSCKNVLNGRVDDDCPLFVDWVSGAFMMVRKKAVDQVGPMDERFFMYWEDADWCKRMSEGGWRIAYYPEASILHYTGCSSRKNFLRSLLEFHRSAFRFFCKYNRNGGYVYNVLTPLVFIGLSARFFVLLLLKSCSQWSWRTK
jgi:hypothetical protein